MRALLLVVLLLAHPGLAAAQGEYQSPEQVMQSFVQTEREEGGVQKIPDQRKHEILFYMGIALLIGLLLTAYFGLAMAVFGKQTFVAHMVFAGLSLTLAIAHAVTAIVWFFPF